MRQQHRIIRRNGVQRGMQGEAFHVRIGRAVPLGLMPSAPQNPLARLGLFSGASHLRDDLIPGAGLAQIESKPVFADAGEVPMAFDKAGDGELPVQIDYRSPRTNPFVCIGIAAQRRDPIAARRQRLHGRPRRVHRDNLAIAEDEIGRLAEGYGGEEDGERGESHENQDNVSCRPPERGTARDRGVREVNPWSETGS